MEKTPSRHQLQWSQLLILWMGKLKQHSQNLGSPRTSLTLMLAAPLTNAIRLGMDILCLLVHLPHQTVNSVQQGTVPSTRAALPAGVSRGILAKCLKGCCQLVFSKCQMSAGFCNGRSGPDNPQRTFVGSGKKVYSKR